MEGDLQRAVGTNLRLHRTLLGISQERVAEVLQVHRTYIGQIERGERNLTLRSIERLASELDVDPLTLLVSRQSP